MVSLFNSCACVFVCCVFLVVLTNAQQKFADYFTLCQKNSNEFDSCIRDALNNIRPFFKTGVPEWGLPPFDPFMASEVVQKIGIPNLNYKLKLKNVRESGWTISHVTQFRSDWVNNLIQYTQFFPDKYLEGDYEMVGTIMGQKISNKGHWNLTLYDLIQTTTISRKPRTLRDGTVDNKTPLKVNVNVQTIKNLDLHISNLLRGRKILESILDRIINATWKPGFTVIRPLINDLVSTAFTEIFNKAFFDFPFDRLLSE